VSDALRLYEPADAAIPIVIAETLDDGVIIRKADTVSRIAFALGLVLTDPPGRDRLYMNRHTFRAMRYEMAYPSETASERARWLDDGGSPT